MLIILLIKLCLIMVIGMYVNLYLSDSSEEEENAPREPRLYLERLTLDGYNDIQVVKHFRLPRASINALADRIADNLNSLYETREADISAVHKLQIALYYYATGDHQKTIARACGVSQPIVSRAITQVTDVLFGITHEFVKFPENLEEIKAGFYAVCSQKKIKIISIYTESSHAPYNRLFGWHFFAHSTASK